MLTPLNLKPNWQQNGYQSKEEAAIKAIGLVMKRTPDATISWQDQIWTKQSFKKELLTKLELKVKTSTAKGPKGDEPKKPKQRV